MNGSRRSIPFHVTLLTLMVLIVLPLAAALLWLGWRAVDQLEDRSVRHRMVALDSAVEGFLMSGLRVVVAVGSTLAETQAFAPGSTVADEERLRQFAVVIGRYPAMAAIYVGYEDGRFLYVGRTETLSISQRLEFDAPDAPSLLMRTIAAGEGMRRETWWFEMADGSRSPVQTRMVDYDPRARPWYVDAMRAKGAVLTEPYSFAQAKVVGVSAGMPLRQGGVIGFDFTLNTLSRLIGDYRFTANSIIMVASDTGAVFMELEACRLDGGTCLPGEDEVRTGMRAAIAQAIGSGERIERDVALGGRDYRLLVHQMPPALGRRYLVAAAVPIVELSVDLQTLLERAALAAAVAVALAILGVLLASLHAVAIDLAHRRQDRAHPRPRFLRPHAGREPHHRDRAAVRFGRAHARGAGGVRPLRVEESRAADHALARDRRRRRPAARDHGDVHRHRRLLADRRDHGAGAADQPAVALLRCAGHRRSWPTTAPSTSTSATASWPSGTRRSRIADHIVNACRAALQAAAAGRQLSEKWRQLGRPGFRTRFGLHTGLAVVGNVGAREHINYTLVGAVANQASRMEGLEQDVSHRDPGHRRGRARRRRLLRVAPDRSHRGGRHDGGARDPRADGRGRCRRPNMPTSLSSGGPAGRPTSPAVSTMALAASMPRRRSGPTTARAGCSSTAARFSCATARRRGWNGTWHFDSK